ncbi:response regulator [Sphingomonas donggukensis]|uniref:protein-glutamate methylesterase n=1 Tax=Sphingomonas donggukensis TaxID=2949093 RepID=A0ABY4TYX8_9SPHN|nr:chemotaxis protein CheB [Sphingomonas donggukensis]URW76752.1 response regulator [Sphingomonas donggukensis]
MTLATHNRIEAEPAPSIASVLIVDDSIVARAAFGRIIDATARFVVAGAVGTVAAALDFLDRHRVEIVLLDLELPGTDGLTGLPDLIAAGQGAKVFVVSAAAGEGAVATLQALALGAADTLVKPGLGAGGRRFSDVLIERLERLVDANPDPLPAAPPRAEHAHPPLPPFDIVAIGASTGGIHALSALLRALPATFDVPILVTQHLPASFMPYFAAQLALLAGRPCDVAENHMRVRPGRIVIAPGHAHMRLAKMDDGASIRLTSEASASGCLPSVDPMFASLAEVYGKRGLGVVLSGMGRDGAIGARALTAAGASVVVQDRRTSVVWGMPGAVANSGGATAVLPPDAIGRLIALQRSAPGAATLGVAR